MINRRSALLNIPAVAVTAVAGSTIVRPAHAQAPMLPAPLVGPRMNFAQADKVMAQLGLDALVLGAGVNVYHATGLDLTSTKMGFTPATYAVVTRRENQRLSLIAAAFSYYYTIAMDAHTQTYPVYTFTAPGDGAEGGEPKAQPLTILPNRNLVQPDFIEGTRAATVMKAVKERPVHADLMHTLRKVLSDTGVSKGRIAVDLAPVWQTTAEAAPGATIVDADDALRRIRPVKSAMELTLMRQAAEGNAAAAIEAAQTVRAGADVRELRAAYFAAAAKRGMRGVFMVIDRVSSPTYSAKLREGQCFSIDCVGEYMGYHGDYSRAVFIGEPPRSMKSVTTATGQAWDIVRETIKPGIRFSDIRARGQTALKGLGVDYNISFGPHSVGLYHDDHVGNAGSPPREDIVLEPGMVISVDCPFLETGNGGSSHLEDLTLVTADGSEQIHDIGNRTITV